MFEFSSLLLAFRNDERVFLHLDWLEGACIVLRLFFLHISFLLFPPFLCLFSSFTFLPLGWYIHLG